jgi:hypothetical protein
VNDVVSGRAIEEAHVELNFTLSPELVAIVRRFVAAFYERLVSHADAASRMALATHELLENSVKFSRDGMATIHLSISPGPKATEISIRTSNQSTPENRDNAIRIVGELQSSGDAFAYYQQIMRQNAKRRDGSGLGLARICAEAEMTLACEVSGDELALVARARIPGEVGANLGLLAVASSTFNATPSFDGNSILVRFTGNADLSAQGALESLLPRIHAEAQRRKTAQVIIDFTALEFMNSTCFHNFVSWVSDVQDLPRAQQYRIRLRANAAILWQRRSLHALKCFADELIEIEP